MQTMSNSLLTKLLTLAAGLLVCGCAHRQMIKQSAIQMANRAFEAAGHTLTDYKKPKVDFERVFTNAEWVVTYEPLSPNDGPTYWVQVGDKTGATTISHCK
jgi:hypothetical protein